MVISQNKSGNISKYFCDMSMDKLALHPIIAPLQCMLHILSKIDKLYHIIITFLNFFFCGGGRKENASIQLLMRLMHC
jgi:hypothetical protein